MVLNSWLEASPSTSHTISFSTAFEMEPWCGYNKPDRGVNMNQEGVTNCLSKNKKFILQVEATEQEKR